MNDGRPVLFDVNALVALTVGHHVNHRAAHGFLAGVQAWATSPLTEAALVRLLLNPQVTGRASEGSAVLRVAAGMRQDPRWHWLPDSTSLATPLIDTRVLGGHRQVTDLHLVNLAASNGHALATFDRAIPTWLAPADRRHVTLIPV